MKSSTIELLTHALDREFAPDVWEAAIADMIDDLARKHFKGLQFKSRDGSSLHNALPSPGFSVDTCYFANHGATELQLLSRLGGGRVATQEGVDRFHVDAYVFYFINNVRVTGDKSDFLVIEYSAEKKDWQPLGWRMDENFGEFKSIERWSDFPADKQP